MIWILSAALGVGVFANLPLIYSASRFDWATFAALWRFAPHQFVFSLFCVPAATFLTGVSIWWVVRALNIAADADPVRWEWWSVNWPVVMLIAVAVGSLCAAAFFVSTAWSPDKLAKSYPAAAVEAIAEIESQYQNAGSANEIEALDLERAAAAKAVTSTTSSGANLTAELHGYSAFARANALLTQQGQQKFRVTDGTAVALSAFQVLSIVGVGFVLLLVALGLLLLGRQSGSDIPHEAMDGARSALFWAIALYVPYPYLFGLYRFELDRVVVNSGTGGQEIVASSAIILASALTVFSISSAEFTIVGSIPSALIGLAAVFGAILPHINNASVAMRQVIGYESSIGAQFAVVALLLVVVSLAIAMTWPRV